VVRIISAVVRSISAVVRSISAVVRIISAVVRIMHFHHISQQARTLSYLSDCTCRVGQNHIRTVYVVYFWQGSHQ
jgi:hypothetical protein